MDDFWCEYETLRRAVAETTARLDSLLQAIKAGATMEQIKQELEALLDEVL